MGGLAVRFASSDDYVPTPITRDQVSQVVTINTPHRGSPWGGTLLAEIKQTESIIASHGAMPYAGRAATCLAPHDSDEFVAEECEVPPYLPQGVDLMQIEPGNHVDRDLFGITLWTVNQRGDGIVLADSANGYPGSAGQPSPTGYELAHRTVSCNARASEQHSWLRALLGGMDNQLGVLFLRSWTDQAAMDSILAGRLDVWTAGMWGATALVSRCGHGPLTEHPETLGIVSDVVERALMDQPFRPDLSKVQVPASCDQPERGVEQGFLDHGDGKGTTSVDWQNPHEWWPTEDFRLRAVTMECTSVAEVSWPGLLLFFDDDGRRVGEVYVHDFVDDAFLGSVNVAAEQDQLPDLALTWSADRLSTGPGATGTGTVTWNGSELVVEAPSLLRLDVSGYDAVDFSSPRGGIQCTMSDGEALCHLPSGMDDSGVPDSDFCGEFIGLVGVGAGEHAGWVCSGGVLSTPDLRSPRTDWFDGRGWPTAVMETSFGSTEMAALPYGGELVMGALSCTSDRDGVRCSRSDTGAGFWVAKRGVELYGPVQERYW